MAITQALKDWILGGARDYVEHGSEGSTKLFQALDDAVPTDPALRTKMMVTLDTARMNGGAFDEFNKQLDSVLSDSWAQQWAEKANIPKDLLTDPNYPKAVIDNAHWLNPMGQELARQYILGEGNKAVQRQLLMEMDSMKKSGMTAMQMGDLPTVTQLGQKLGDLSTAVDTGHPGIISQVLSMHQIGRELPNVIQDLDRASVAAHPGQALDLLNDSAKRSWIMKGIVPQLPKAAPIAALGATALWPGEADAGSGDVARTIGKDLADRASFWAKQSMEDLIQNPQALVPQWRTTQLVDAAKTSNFIHEAEALHGPTTGMGLWWIHDHLEKMTGVRPNPEQIAKTYNQIVDILQNTDKPLTLTKTKYPSSGLNPGTLYSSIDLYQINHPDIPFPIAQAAVSRVPDHYLGEYDNPPHPDEHALNVDVAGIGKDALPPNKTMQAFRMIREALQKDYPDSSTIVGHRVTGVNPGRDVKYKLGAAAGAAVGLGLLGSSEDAQAGIDLGFIRQLAEGRTSQELANDLWRYRGEMRDTGPGNIPTLHLIQWANDFLGHSNGPATDTVNLIEQTLERVKTNPDALGVKARKGKYGSRFDVTLQTSEGQRPTTLGHVMVSNGVQFEDPSRGEIYFDSVAPELLPSQFIRDRILVPAAEMHPEVKTWRIFSAGSENTGAQKIFPEAEVALPSMASEHGEVVISREDLLKGSVIGGAAALTLGSYITPDPAAASSIPTLGQLINNETFQRLHPSDQMKLRESWWYQYGLQDPTIISMMENDRPNYLKVRAKVLGLPEPELSETMGKTAVSFVRGIGSGTGAEAAMSLLTGEDQAAKQQAMWGDVNMPAYLAGQGIGFMGALHPVAAAGRAVGLGSKALAAIDVAAGGLLMGSQEAVQNHMENKAALENIAKTDIMGLRTEGTGQSDAEAIAMGTAKGVLWDLGLRGIFKVAGVATRTGWNLFKYMTGVGTRRTAEAVAAGVHPPPEAQTAIEDALAKGGETLNPAEDLMTDRVISHPSFNITEGYPSGPNPKLVLKDGTEATLADLRRGWVQSGDTTAAEQIAGLKKGRYTADALKQRFGLDAEAAVQDGLAKGAGGKTPLYSLTDLYFQKNPPTPGPKIGWDDIAEVHAPKQWIADLYAEFGRDMPIEAKDVANTVVLRRIKGKFLVYVDGKATTFNTADDAVKFAGQLPTGASFQIESAALRALQRQGWNPMRLVEAMGINKEDLKTLAEMSGGNDARAEVLPTFPKAVSALVREFRPRKSAFLSYQDRYGVPLYDKVYQPIEEAYNNKRLFTHPFQEQIGPILKGVSRKQKEGYAYLLETKPGTDEFKDIVEEYGLNPGKHDEIMTWFKGLFDKWGLDAERYFQEEVPRIKQNLSVSRAYPDRHLAPDATQFFRRHIENGIIPLHDVNPNVEALMGTHLHQGAFQRLVANAYDTAESEFGTQAFRKLPIGAQSLAQNYLDDIIGKSTDADRALMTGVGHASLRVSNLWNKMRGRGGVADEYVTPQEAERAGKRLYGYMFALNYSANLSFRPAAVGRQFLQTFQTTLPRFGHWAVFAKDGAIARLGTQEGRDLIERSGILVEEAPFQGEEGVRTIGGGIFRRADNVQRAVAGLAQDSLVQKYLPLYESGQKDWVWFTRKTALEKYHPIVQSQYKELIDAGKTMQARLGLMREASEATQYIYRKGNQPEFFRGVKGRMFGQYGIWPVYYVDYLHSAVAHGSWQSRVGEVARLIEANAAIYGGIKFALGGDATKWTFFAPLSFQGGPLAQVALDIPRSMDPGPEGQLAKSRLKRSWQQFVPGMQAMRDVAKLTEAHDPADLARIMLGYPAAK